ncbi:MAG TPA: rRNA maturation RNase YbeY [Acidimicrobiia bacterium]|nr:rRNA maturation RNase YbeY [Acidimicrobiia bacterium]
MRIEFEDQHGSSDVDPDSLRRWAEQALLAEGYPTNSELSITMVTDQEMARLHAEALGTKAPTDVLSFPLDEMQPGLPPQFQIEGPPRLLGDIVIAPDYIRRQAEDLDVSFQDEMALMITHGVLHLLGYDHETDSDAEAMEHRERIILKAQGLSRR